MHDLHALTIEHDRDDNRLTTDASIILQRSACYSRLYCILIVSGFIYNKPTSSIEINNKEHHPQQPGCYSRDQTLLHIYNIKNMSGKHLCAFDTLYTLYMEKDLSVSQSYFFD